MTARLSPQREAEMKPVGYYCDHSDEPYGSRSHHDWQWVEGEGFVFQHQPDTITALAHVEQTYLKPEDRQKRCALAVPVYPGPVVAAELAAVRAERDEALALAANPHTPRLCLCGHSHLAHTVPAPHSCFAYGQTCPCPQYRQLLPDEAVAQLERNRRAAAELARADEEAAR